MLKFTTLKTLFFTSLFVVVLSIFPIKHNEIPDCHKEPSPIVLTKSGYVQGIVSYTDLSRPFFAYKGIPYAQPPIGEYRFKSPIPADPWDGVRAADEFGPICMQKDDLFAVNGSVIGSEDCLYINVYVPDMSEIENIHLLPVMVFIHYGGLFSGNGNDDTLGPEYLMEKDVVVVTFNYRLGVLGFLSSGDSNAPGNYGFKDQRLALQWVQDNIENFGGDSDQVTIFGQSAGSGSVHHHVLSPTSKGLFHRAIAQSGSALNLWAIPIPGSLAYELVTKKQAAFVGCSIDGSTEDVINCLKTVDAEALVDSLEQFRYFGNEPLNMYTPVLEVRDEENLDPFILQNPIEIIASGNYNKVPFIMGLVGNEGILRTSYLTRNPEIFNELNENFNTYIKTMMGLSISVGGQNVTNLYNNIVNQYFLGNEEIDIDNPDSVQGFTDLFGDRIFNFGTYQAILAHSLTGHSPLWFYEFDYRGKYSYGDLFAKTPNNINFKWGTSHCDDLIYLFKSPTYFPELTETDCYMRGVLIDLWTNFATYGHPTPFNSIYETVEMTWYPLPDISNYSEARNSDLYLLEFGGGYDTGINLTMKVGYKPERMEFWTNQHLMESFPNIN